MPTTEPIEPEGPAKRAPRRTSIERASVRREPARSTEMR
jgi:hypothetical protein